MAEKHYSEQIRHTQNYLIPYIQKYLSGSQIRRILEVGCAEGGGVKALQDAGFMVTGIDIEKYRIDMAREKNPGLDFRVMDITDRQITEALGHFDLIIMRDVIEHIPDRKATFSVLRTLLRNNGYLYVTFPPRYSAFAGHQQNGRSIMRRMPFVHVLPGILIRGIGKLVNENPDLVESFTENFKVGLTIRAFEKHFQEHAFQPVVKELFLIRPVFKTRFNLTPRRLPPIPLFREFLALGCEYLLMKGD